MAIPSELDRIAQTRRFAVRLPTWRKYLMAVGITTAATLAALVLRSYLAPTNLAMVFLLGVVATAVRCEQAASILASFLSVALFDFFCVPPYYTLRITDYEYVVTFVGMLVVALVISTQTERIRIQIAHTMERDVRTRALYRLSRRLASQNRVFDAALAAAEVAEEVFGAPVVIFLPEGGRISFRKRTADQLPVPTSEEPVAQAVFDLGRKAGRGAEMFPEVAATYLPLKGTGRIVGVLCVPPGGSNIFGNERQHLLDLFANQTAVAIERTLNLNAAESARFQMQAEEMRSSLLSSVSHDLRTPLASIAGAASTLRSQGEKLAPEVREELLDSISDETQRMSRLVGNLLDLTRLESGVQLRSELCPLEEIVGAALQRMETQLRDRRVITQLPEDLPPVSVDDVLMGQVIVNLMENAIKYTPDETAIELVAEARPGVLELAVLDRGPGFAPGEEKRVFDKFYRGKSEGARGAGLGLAICKAIVTAHGGAIEAANRPQGGAVFRVRLPLEAPAETPR